MTTHQTCWDDFATDCRRGRVIGTSSTSGHIRLGVDAEGVFSIDNGALRVAPIIEAGFGRAVLAYGPFETRPGLAFGVHVLNGHNTAQAESLPDTFRERMTRWAAGSGTDPVLGRLAGWVRSGRVSRTLRQFRWWRRVRSGGRQVPPLDENLAVGWFASEVVPDPRKEGDAFIMHALGTDNGELWVGPPSCRMRPLHGVQNLPLYLVAVIRNSGVVYYVSSVEGAPGIAPYPRFRPVATAQSALSDRLYLAIQQSVLGQIGFRVDSRLQAVRVTCLDGYDSWYGGAATADGLSGVGDLEGQEAGIGGRWSGVVGRVQRGRNGATCTGGHGMAVLPSGEPIGLVQVLATQGDAAATVLGLIWRFRDERNHWRLELSATKCDLVLVEDGDRKVMASNGRSCSPSGQEHRLAVLDDGKRIMGYVDGDPLSTAWVMDGRFKDQAQAGILIDGDEQGTGTLRAFEAHPRDVEMPGGLGFEAPKILQGSRLTIADDFSGDAAELEGRLTSLGQKRWHRLIGTGRMALSGDGAACVQAVPEHPCPGRTAYVVDWDQPGCADLAVVLTPPGTRPGQKQQCTAGFVLYQDPDNYVTLNVYLSDWYPAASVSTFFKFEGFEDIYDAVWSNIGQRVTHGRPARLRLCCDGERYSVHVNGEPVLYRTFSDVYADFTRLEIRKVGLIANWEFGTDTGSRFQGFEARS